MARGNGNPNAPFWVALRAYERSLIRDALDASGSLEGAAHLLGMNYSYIFNRCRTLGGVVDSDPREPFAWNGLIQEKKNNRLIRHKQIAEEYLRNHPDIAAKLAKRKSVKEKEKEKEKEDKVDKDE